MKIQTKILALFVLSTLIIILSNIVFPSMPKNKSAADRLWSHKVHHNEKYSSVWAGDSRVYKGIDASILSTQTIFESSYNFGFSSAGLNQYYLDFVANKVDRNAANKLIIIGVSAHLFTPTAMENEQLKELQAQLPIEVYKNLYLNGFKSNFVRYEPIYILRRWLNMNFDFTEVQTFTSEGGILIDPIGSAIDEGEALYKNRFTKEKIDFNSLDNFIIWCQEMEEEGINIVAYRPPTSKGMKEIEDLLSGLDYTNLQIKLEAVGVNWISVNYEDYYSYDGSHIDRESALKLSRYLTNEIKSIFQ
jgi:hypothetical protein